MPDKTERAQMREDASEKALPKELREGKEILRRNLDYEPSRETDKYILDRLLENLPFQRPDPEPPRAVDNVFSMTDTEKAAMEYTPGAKKDWFDWHSSPKDKLKGWETYKKDLETFHNKYETDRKAWDEAVARLRKASDFWGNTPDTLTAADEQRIQDLQNEVAAHMAAPGAQEDRPGRLQEIKEALDLTDPESGGRAFLRELKRKMVDDKAQRIHAGWKTKSGEEVLKDKLIKMELADIPRNRARAMQALGWSGIPKTVRLTDDSGNPVPRYVDEMKADREAAAEKAYRQHRRDPMKDTPERD